MDRTYRILSTLRIRIPDRLYLAASSKVEPRRPRPAMAPPRQQARPKPAGKSGGGQGQPVRRRFELPKVPLRAATDQSVIQPRPDLLGVPSLKLPEMFFWAPRPERLPAKPFVEPGYVRPPVQRARLNAPPRLDVPEVTLSALAAPHIPSSASLPLPPPPSLPVQTSVSSAPSQGAADVAFGPGDPTNVLALSASALPLREYVTVPPGTQIGDTPGAGSGGALEGASGGSGKGAGGTGTKAGPGSGSGTGSGAGSGSGLGSGSGEGGLDDFGSAEFNAAVEATRKVSPSDGIFDVVVQSSSPEGFSASAGVLSGKPVYSVYLRVGAKRDWILQYCIPAEDEEKPRAGGMVITLSAPKKLAAPFPLVTYRPPPRRSSTRYLTLHGYITSDGRFQDLHVFGVHDPWQAAAALFALQKWEFRPATADGKPARVEVLLAIPPE